MQIKMPNTKLAILLLFTTITNIYGNNLPSYIKPCSASDPNLNKCALKHGQDALHEIIKGDSNYKIPSLMPLRLPEIKFNSGNLDIKLTDVEISGFDNTKIEDIKINLQKQHLSVVLHIDRANLVSNYDINGKILVLPIKGDGRANITFVGGSYRYRFDFALKEKGGEKYVDVTKHSMDYTTKRAYFEFDNLFGGDSALGSHMNQFLNDNWKEVEHEIGPAISQAIDTIITTIVNGIFSVVPMDSMFLK